jgi:CubicO group peptidase (beta-lactamase class C family)
MIETKVPGLVSDGIGLVVGLIDRGNTNIHGYGSLHDGTSDPPDGRTLYEIGSTTKVFTTTLLADMVARCEIELQQPVRDVLPEVPTLPESITLLSLATHTSGLPRLPGNIWRSLLKNRNDPYANYSQADLLDYLRSVRNSDIVKTAGLINYSNLGMGLLGHALSLHLAITYEEAILQRICHPLGLSDTVITLSAKQEARLAQAHSGNGKQTSNFHIPALPGAGALLSSIEDLVHFLYAHLTSEDTLKLALSNTLQVRYSKFAPDFWLLRFYGKIRRWLDRQPQPEPEALGIGLGWMCMGLPKSSAVAWCHNGGTGGYRSFAAFVPETQTGVVVLSNRGFSELEIVLPRYTVDRLGFDLLDALNFKIGNQLR